MEEHMATRTDSNSRSRNSQSGAFSWGDNTGPLIGAAIAGAGLAFAAHFGRKAIMQGLEASAGDWGEMLKKDHDEIRGILDQIIATDDSQTWKRSMLLMKLAHKLDKHSYEEETVIYPALRDDNDVQQADELDKEHGHVKTFIFELKQMETDDPNWIGKIRDLRDALLQHMRMEEDQIIPNLRKDLDEETNSKLTMMVNKAGFMMA
jgi:hemerythrin superfamily protein